MQTLGSSTAYADVQGEKDQLMTGPLSVLMYSAKNSSK